MYKDLVFLEGWRSKISGEIKHLSKKIVKHSALFRAHCIDTKSEGYYSLIAFDKRVTFWLQRVQSLPCACAYVALFACRFAYNHYVIAHAYNAANTHAQGSDLVRWSQKVNSLVEGNWSIDMQSTDCEFKSQLHHCEVLLFKTAHHGFSHIVCWCLKKFRKVKGWRQTRYVVISHLHIFAWKACSPTVKEREI